MRTLLAVAVFGCLCAATSQAADDWVTVKGRIIWDKKLAVPKREPLKAAQDAVKALVVLKGYGIFGTSPAGQSTDAVFAKASGVIDDLIEEVNQAITVLTQNLHASVDAVLKDQEVSQVDYAKLTQDNKDRVDNLGDTGIKPGDDNYVAPVATTGPSGTDPATQPGTDPGTQPGTDPGADPDATSTSS